jgi:hypothetical protein
MVMKCKRAQMKIQQTAFMLIAVTIFLVMAGMFFLTIKLSGLKEAASSLEEENARLLVTKLANSPEFSCGEAFGSKKIDCVDLDKVNALIKNIDAYEDFWDVSGIELRKIYPEEEVIEIYNKEKGGFTYSNFVSLCSKENEGGNIYDKCELARLFARYNKLE